MAETNPDNAFNEQIKQALARSLNKPEIQDRVEEDKAVAIARENAARSGQDPDAAGEKARKEVRSKRAIRSKATGKPSDPPTPTMPTGPLRKPIKPAPLWSGPDTLAVNDYQHSNKHAITLGELKPILDSELVIEALTRIIFEARSPEEVKLREKLVGAIAETLKLIKRRSKPRKNIPGQASLLEEKSPKTNESTGDSDYVGYERY